MNTNIEFFSIYTAEIFLFLADAFPLRAVLIGKDFIQPYLDLSWDEELLSLKERLSAAELKVVMNGLNADNKKAVFDLQEQIEDLSSRKLANEEFHKDLLIDTVDLLVFEKFLRMFDDGNYQLTIKGYSALNKKLNGEMSSGLATLQSLLPVTNKTAAQIVMLVRELLLER